MNVPSKFVSKWNEEQIKELNGVTKNSQKAQTRRRAQAILLSNRGCGIDEMAKFFEMNRETISIWIDKWEQAGISGLEDKPRSGRPCTLPEKELVIKLAKENPRSIVKVIALLKKKRVNVSVTQQ